MKELKSSSVFIIREWDELHPETHELFYAAIGARMKARAAYSHFMVGAAIRTDAGLIYAGCNIEDIGHNGTIHAETSALGAMIPRCSSMRESVVELAIALDKESVQIGYPPKRTGADIKTISEIVYTPCGHCRQMLAQYQPKKQPTKVFALQPNGQILVTDMRDLYPLGFNF